MKVKMKDLLALHPCGVGLNELNAGDKTVLTIDDYKHCSIGDIMWTLVRLRPDLKQIAVDTAIYAAELVLPIFEKQYPNDDRSRKAIEVAKSGVNCRAAANAADAAACAAACAAAYAAVYAIRAAYAADAAEAAYAASYASAEAAACADSSAKNKIKEFLLTKIRNEA